MTRWQLWLHLDLGHSASLGAVGPHACASLSTLVRHLPFDDAPTLALVPLPQPAPCAVAIDAPLLAEDPTVARLLPPTRHRPTSPPQRPPPQSRRGRRDRYWLPQRLSSIVSRKVHQDPAVLT